MRPNETSETWLSCTQGCWDPTEPQSLSIAALATLTALFVSLLILNAKGLPFAHFFSLLPAVCKIFWPRVFPTGGRKKATAQKAPIGQPGETPPPQAASASLFRHHTTSSRASLSDLDLNMHKSNSTFFSDADSSRVALLAQLLSTSLAELGPANFLLAAVQCRFVREIKPFHAYDISSRVFTWDDKSFYLITYFLKPGCRLPRDIELVGGGPAALLRHDVHRKSVLAVLLTRFVFKAGRTSLAPATVLKQAGLLLDSSEDSHGGGLGKDELSKVLADGQEFVTECMR